MNNARDILDILFKSDYKNVIWEVGKKSKKTGTLKLFNEVKRIGLEFITEYHEIDDDEESFVETKELVIDITSFKSKDGFQYSKKNPRIRILTVDGKITVFRFKTGGERDEVIKSLNKMKKLLSLRTRLSDEEKNRIQTLFEDPAVSKLYDNLVSSNILSHEDFWNRREREFIREDQKKTEQNMNIIDRIIVEEEDQIKIQLTPEIIKILFRQYPNTKENYHKKVPIKMSEKEFWEDFVRKIYFHRHREKNKIEIKKRKIDSQQDEKNRLEQLMKLSIRNLPQDCDLSRNPEKNFHGGLARKLEDDLPPRTPHTPTSGEIESMMDFKNRESFKAIRNAGYSSSSEQQVNSSNLVADLLPAFRRVVRFQKLEISEVDIENEERKKRWDNLIDKKEEYVISFKDSLDEHSEEKNDNFLERLEEKESKKLFSDVFGTIEGNVVETKDRLNKKRLFTNEDKVSKDDENFNNLRFKDRLLEEIRVIEELLKHFWSCFPMTVQKERVRISLLLQKKIGKIIDLLKKKSKFLEGWKKREDQEKFGNVFTMVLISIDLAVKKYETYLVFCEDEESEESGKKRKDPDFDREEEDKQNGGLVKKRRVE